MLSIIIPAYNEEDNILRTVQVLLDIMSENQIPCELIFINDGSKDKTQNLIEQSAKEHNNIRGICFSRNFGKEACMFAGLKASRGDCCVVIDCDLQHPPETIPMMYKYWQNGYEVVEGVKRSRGRESVLYKMSAGMFYKIMSRFIGMDMEASSDFKLLDRKVVDVLCELPEKSTFFRALSFWAGFKSTTIEYDVVPREFGVTKWSFIKLVRYAINNIVSFTSAPLQIVTIMGTLSILFSALLFVHTLGMWVIGASVEGFTTVIMLLLLIGGAIMLSLGIIGFYISKIFEEVKGRPQYIISKECGTVNEKPQTE